MYIRLLNCLLCLPMVLAAAAQTPKGKLFIIGGGNRDSALLQSMVSTAGLRQKDYIVVLPMSSSQPDTSFHYFQHDMRQVCQNSIVNFNFTAEKVNHQAWLDSLAHARLIFITGGDQSRFMKAVLNTPVFQAIHEAYNNGATIGGTSAGAAVMSRQMITGNELRGDTAYHASFGRLWYNNIEFAQGLGLLDNAIIDQHFVARSRYNRLISALAAFPGLACIGIDESTAIIVAQNKVTVTGESQVLVMKNPQALSKTGNGLIKWNDVSFAIYTAGDSFELTPGNP